MNIDRLPIPAFGIAMIAMVWALGIIVVFSRFVLR